MLVGESAVMHDLRTKITRIAQTSFTVLVEGESGVGKELAARGIHQGSSRRLGPFVAVNCAALVETLVEAELFGIEERTATGVRGRRGKFELADDGTLFLDEVADLAPVAQAKLLRVLQDMAVERVGATAPHRVNVRVIAATNRNLRQLVEERRFRLDLYYRLAGVELFVPPLRARRSDIPLLIAHFGDTHQPGLHHRFTPAAMEALLMYEWPGNVRQLQRVLERAVALAPGPAVGLSDLPEEITRLHRTNPIPVAQTDQTLRAWSSRYVRLVVDRCAGNKRKACELLNISYNTLKTHLRYDSAVRAAACVPMTSVPLYDGPGALEVRSPTAG